MPGGGAVPLGEVAKVAPARGPSSIRTENGQLATYIYVDIRDRDLGGYVAEAQRAVEASIQFPPGYYVMWSGQYEYLERAAARLKIVVPLTLAIIFLLLYLNFQAALPALLIFLNIPLAATGGIVALLVRGMPFSISAGVGFIALFGIAVLNGIVLLTYIRELRQKRLAIEKAVEQGAETRLRPVLMTALVASLGFIPMAVSHGAGAEVQRPLATVVIGGLTTSTLLTLLVLPTLYQWIEQRREERNILSPIGAEGDGSRDQRRHESG